MAIVITYDIPTRHVEFKLAMAKLGYVTQLQDSVCKIIFLPNTTLYHESKDAVAAREDAWSVCKSLNIQLERCIATIWSGWAAKCGQPFST